MWKRIWYLSETDSPPREEGWLRHQENFGRSPPKRRRRGGRSHRNVPCERPPRPLSRPPLLTRRGLYLSHNFAYFHFHHDDVSRQAVRLLKYLAVSASERSQSVLLSSLASSSNALKFPSVSRRERSAVLLDRTRLMAFNRRLCSTDSVLLCSLSWRRFI